MKNMQTSIFGYLERTKYGFSFFKNVQKYNFDRSYVFRLSSPAYFNAYDTHNYYLLLILMIAYHVLSKELLSSCCTETNVCRI